MKTPSYEDYEANPSAVLTQVEQAARNARAQALHQLVVVPLKQRFVRLTSKPVLQHA